MFNLNSLLQNEFAMSGGLTKSLPRCQTVAARHRGPSIADKRSARANRIAADLVPSDRMSLNGIAAALDRRHVPTPGGSGHWHAAQVSRLLKRLAARARWTTNPWSGWLAQPCGDRARDATPRPVLRARGTNLGWVRLALSRY
jgi:hypothetical protein